MPHAFGRSKDTVTFIHMVPFWWTRDVAIINPALGQGLVLSVLSLERPCTVLMLGHRLRCWRKIEPALGVYVAVRGTCAMQRYMRHPASTIHQVGEQPLYGDGNNTSAFTYGHRFCRLGIALLRAP